MPSPPGRLRRLSVVVPAAAVAIVAVIFFVTRSSPPVPSRGSDDAALDASPNYRVVDHPDLGFAVELPPNWSESPDDPGLATVFFARSPSTQSWIRVFRRETPLGVPEMLDQATAALTQQGGSNFSRQPTVVGTLPAFRLDFKLPLLFGGAGPLSSQTYFMVKRDATVYTLEVATIDATNQGPALARIASRFRLL